MLRYSVLVKQTSSILAWVIAVSLIAACGDGDGVDTGIPLDENSSNRTVAIQYTAKKKRKSRLDFRVGFRSKLKVQTSARYRKKFTLSREIQLRFTETGFWKQEKGFGETTKFDFEKQLNPLTLLRWVNSGTYSETGATGTYDQRAGTKNVAISVDQSL